MKEQLKTVKQDISSVLMQKGEEGIKIIPPTSPLVNNLKVVKGAEPVPHVQKVEESFPLNNEAIEDLTDELMNEMMEFYRESDQLVEDELPDTSIDLTKDEFSLTELLKMKETEIPFLVENIIPANAITFLAGDSDAGKSLLYTQICNAIIEGKIEGIGLKIKSVYKRALIVNSEDYPVAITVRVKRQLNGRILSDDISDRMRILTNGYDAAKRISKILEEFKVDLVVLDAFSDIYQDDMNSSNAVRNFLQQFSDIAQKYGCAILIVHHIGKGKANHAADKSLMLGSVGTHGKSRSVIQLSKIQTNPNFKTLKIVKSNYLDEEAKKKEIMLEFDPKTLLHKVVVDESHIEKLQIQQQENVTMPSKRKKLTPQKLEEAYILRQEGKRLREIEKIIGVSYSQISRSLKDYQPQNYVS